MSGMVKCQSPPRSRWRYRNHAEQAACHYFRLPRPARVARHQRYGKLDEVGPGAEAFEDRSHDDEQHHERDENVGDEPENAVHRGVDIRDDHLRGKALVAEQFARQIGSEIGVQEQEESETGQDNAHCAAAPFQHQSNCDDAECHVADGGGASPPRHLLIVQDKVAECGDAQHDQHKIHRAWPMHGRLPGRGVAHEDHARDEHDEKPE
jgi:hypothetical protein